MAPMIAVAARRKVLTEFELIMFIVVS